MSMTFRWIIALLGTYLLAVPTQQDTEFFKFDRDIYCIESSPAGSCNEWNETTTLYRFSDYFSFCFPGDTYVLSENGPKLMSSLKINDRIFALNIETGRNEYASVKAWLHRDAYSLVNYSRIQVQNHTETFVSSKFHNVAFSDDEATGFKFVKDLMPGDNLISLTEDGEDLIVSDTSEEIEKEGLYSPFTSTGTFYIFPEGFQPVEESQFNAPLILVHSLSQVEHPEQNFKQADQFFDALALISEPYQPTDDEQYVSPLLDNFKGWFFGGDWQESKGQKIAHRYYSGSGNNQQQRQRERIRKTVAVLAVNSIVGDILH